MQPVLRQQGPVAIINHSNYKIMQKNRHCHRVGRYRWHKFGRIMKLCLILVCVFSFGLSATTKAQQERVSLKLENVSLKILLDKIQEQTQLNFMVNREQAELLGLVSVNVQDETVENVLNRVLSNSKLTYVFMDEIIVIKVRQPEEKDKKEKITIRGVVQDDKKLALPGVTVVVKGTSVGTATDTNGNFTLNLPEMKDVVLIFSFIGMKSQEVKYTGQKEINVILLPDVTEMDEVVVTGIFERKAESYTGSTSTYKTEDLKMIGSQNILQSLKTLDPSFHITPNNEFGSDPNKLPDIDIRGKTSVVNLKEEYAVDPNQPLFILDGFEVPLQTVVDLNMERVASVTILKDAASTAIYGSKAANGVVVIETKRPQAGQLRLSYNGDFSVSIPDLSDYNMMNAKEKLEFEWLAGEYSVSWDRDQNKEYQLLNLYNRRLEKVKSGVDTYWLSEPLRTGFVHKHNLYVEGGDDAMLYGVGLNYNGTSGVMKGSDRDVFSFNLDLRYRKGKLRFDNKFTLDYGEANNAPQSFAVYVQTNPYYEKDYEGSIPKYLEESEIRDGLITEVKRPNPLYNASLNYLDCTRSLAFRDNFQIEYRPCDGLMARGRVGLSKSKDETEYFKSPFHSDFDETIKTERGLYQKSTSDKWTYEGDVVVTYGKLLAEKHQVNFVGGWRFASSNYVNDSYKAIGFPDDNIPNPAFANQYAANSKPSYYKTVSRSTSFYLNGNYAFDNRYLLDFNWRKDGSSVFGVNKRFTDSWSVGVAWNIHNETFMGEWMDLLKLRFSVGNPGNQNFSSYSSYNTYGYNTSLQNLFGMGIDVLDFGNPNLKWQKTMDYNVGADIAVLNNRLKVNLDVYYKETDPLLVTTTIASSTGRDAYITNLGAQKTNGFSVNMVVTPIYRPDERINWSLTFNGRHQKQEYSKIGNKLDLINDELKKTSLQRYRDGGSPTDIWAVRSNGIDPATGNELFIKKDGSYTFDYDSNDEVIVGNTEAKLEGVVGSNFYYKGFSFSAYFRYRLGADYFNSELYNRIENITSFSEYNQDKRALYDRWQKVGDHAQYRKITSKVAANETYPMSDRYVQRENTISGESISVAYEFSGQKWLKMLYLSSLTCRANMNDIFRCSTIRAERGTAYPFARTVSFSLSMTF